MPVDFSDMTRVEATQVGQEAHTRITGSVLEMAMCLTLLIDDINKKNDKTFEIMLRQLVALHSLDKAPIADMETANFDVTRRQGKTIIHYSGTLHALCVAINKTVEFICEKANIEYEVFLKQMALLEQTKPVEE